MAINPINLHNPHIMKEGYPLRRPPSSHSDFSSFLNRVMEKPPSQEEIKFLAAYLDWRMKATLFGLVSDNISSPPPTFMTPPNRGEELTTDIDDVVAEAARENRLAPSLIRAVIQVESGWNPRAVSPKGAMGLMQLMPETARMLGVKNPFDVRENVLAGTRYLKSLIDRYDGNIELALAAYNWGPGNLERATRSMPQETVQYVAKVKKYWRGTV